MKGQHKKLREIISGKMGVVVAFSGGVDSSVVARLAKDVLGGDSVAVTINSVVLSRADLVNARKMADEIGIKHRVVEYDILKDEDFAKNSCDRCYFCKRYFSGILNEIGKDMGFGCVMDGTNADDLLQNRPGLRAIKEAGIISPLAEAGIGKEEVRKIAENLGLSCYNRPSNTCLATRIPVGVVITVEELGKIEKAEEFLGDLGVRDLRVRCMGALARIEADTEYLPILSEKYNEIVDRFLELGFKHVTCHPYSLRREPDL